MLGDGGGPGKKSPHRLPLWEASHTGLCQGSFCSSQAWQLCHFEPQLFFINHPKAPDTVYCKNLKQQLKDGLCIQVETAHLLSQHVSKAP